MGPSDKTNAVKFRGSLGVSFSRSCLSVTSLPQPSPSMPSSGLPASSSSGSAMSFLPRNGSSSSLLAGAGFGAVLRDPLRRARRRFVSLPGVAGGDVVRACSSVAARSGQGRGLRLRSLADRLIDSRRAAQFWRWRGLVFTLREFASARVLLLGMICSCSLVGALAAGRRR